MPDIMTPEQRSERMSRVRDKNTKPEKLVRSILHRLGYRFRLHVNNLPGKPDVVLPRFRKVIFVHGCFWHRHGVCRRLSIPKNNPDFWRRKFRENVRRDKKKLKSLDVLGWDVLVIWECETRDREQLRQTLQAFMTKSTKPSQEARKSGNAKKIVRKS